MILLSPYLVPDRDRCRLNMLCSRSSPVTVLYGDGDTVPPPPEKFLDREGASLTDCREFISQVKSGGFWIRFESNFSCKSCQI